MDRLPGEIWCLHEVIEGNNLPSAYCAHTGFTFNTCTCILINNILFSGFEPA
jgi:hypothetical protein